MLVFQLLSVVERNNDMFLKYEMMLFIVVFTKRVPVPAQAYVSM